jgi:hypothetical protein
MKNKRAFKTVIAHLAGITFLICSIWTVNHINLQRKFDSVVKNDSRNQGIVVKARYGGYVKPSVLVFDLQSVSGEKSPADVFRAFLQFADSQQDRQFKTVVLSFRGKAKFKLDGDYFKTLGEEYDYQNPAYTIRTFPEHLKTMDDLSLYEEETGDLLDDLKTEAENFNDFCSEWFLSDLQEL